MNDFGNNFVFYEYLENYVAGFDFDPTGEIVATVDRFETYVISDVNTNGYHFHLEMPLENGFGN